MGSTRNRIALLAIAAISLGCDDEAAAFVSDAPGIAVGSPTTGGIAPGTARITDEVALPRLGLRRKTGTPSPTRSSRCRGLSTHEIYS